MPESAVAQHDHLVVADDLGGPGQLLEAQIGDPGVDLRGVEGRVEDVALLSPGAADQHGVNAFGVVQGDGPRPFRRLVIGVGMDGQETERLQARRSRYRAARP